MIQESDWLQFPDWLRDAKPKREPQEALRLLKLVIATLTQSAANWMFRKRIG